MALVVQNDNGAVLNANGYITVAQFKSYHTDQGNDFSAFNVAASDVLTTAGVFSNTETVTVAGKVYTLQTVLTNVDGNVKIGASTALTVANLVNAINGTGGVPGTDYAAATVANAFVTAAVNLSWVPALTVTAITGGTYGNSIPATTTCVLSSWASTTLLGGVGSDAAIAQAIVRATTYLDSRFSFIGVKLVTSNVQASDALNATANFANGETLTIGGKVYTFQTVLTNVDGHVLIGANTDASLTNLISAINLSGGTPGVNYAASQTLDGNVSATKPASGSIMVLAIVAGVSGNTIAVSSTAANASWTSSTLLGGLSPQSTQWPRQAGEFNFVPWFDINFLAPVIFDGTDLDSFTAIIGPDKQSILGVPPVVKNATAEYSLRALAIALYQDMPAPDGGRWIRSQTVKVDVIEQTTEYEPTQAGGFAMPAYPMADMMLARAGLIGYQRVLMR